MSIDYSRTLGAMSAEAKAELADMLLQVQPIWVPQVGQQQLAADSEADVLFYGGSAGGGKTDLIIGKALTDHHRTLIMRREGTQMRGIIQRITEILGDSKGLSQSQGDKRWAVPGTDKLIEFGSCPNLGDEAKHQGIPHDLLAFDEITHFLEFQFRFLQTWLRSTRPSQRCRVIAAGNPPTSSDGTWVREYWGPWLDPQCPVKAEPGELLWFITHPETGRDTLVDGPDVLTIAGEDVKPLSRTFIPSSVEDNMFLLHTGYKATLQGLPEPLRSQMLKGDFSAGMEDDVWQVIPSKAVTEAQNRWAAISNIPKMTSIGIDVARGGRDHTILARRHGHYFDELLDFPGEMTPDGPSVAALFTQYQRDSATPAVDSIGVGTSVVDFLTANGHDVLAINGATRTDSKDKTGVYGFVNLRAQLYWQFREALIDPESKIALPPDPGLTNDLCAPRFKVTGQGKISVESKEDIIKRIGRSPDKADAVVYAYHHQASATMFQGGAWVSWDSPLNYED